MKRREEPHQLECMRTKHKPVDHSLQFRLSELPLSAVIRTWRFLGRFARPLCRAAVSLLL